MSEEHQVKNPSLADIAAAMKVLQPEQKTGLVDKWMGQVIPVAIIGIAAWLLTGLNSMQQTVTQVSATVVQMSKQIDTMAQDAKSDSGTLAAIKENEARLDQRVGALEGRGNNGNRGTTGSVSDRP